MFEPEGVNRLFDRHGKVLHDLVRLESVLNERFYHMDDAVHAMMLATLSGEPMLMIGPPGTAKSRLIRAFCNLIGISRQPQDGERAAGYFEYLLTQFTEPSELFGFYDLAKLQNDNKLVRDSEGMMQHAEVVFLDEVFNASSAILNSLLTFMNERLFHDRGHIQPTRMRLLFSATNHPPAEAGLAAVYDRFLLRVRLNNVPAVADQVIGLVQAGWTESHAVELNGSEEGDAGAAQFTDVLQDAKLVEEDIDRMTKAGELRVNPASPMFRQLTDIMDQIRRRELSELSNRRIVKMTAIVLYNSLLRSAREGADHAAILSQDLEVVYRFGLDRSDPSVEEKFRQVLAEA